MTDRPAVKRLKTLVERIQARIQKIKEENPSAVLTEEQNRLNEAEDKLQDAEDKMQELKDGIEDVLESQDPKEAFKNTGEDIRALKQDLIEIHKILVHIIGELKGLRVGEGKTPKPSPTP